MESIEPVPVKPTIAFSEFEKIDVRVGTIERVSDVEGADKLLKLDVDFGDHKRVILAGLKQERENPSEIAGKQALFVVNLEPRKMRGEVSEGMLFDIGYADGLVPRLPRAPSPTAPALDDDVTLIVLLGFRRAPCGAAARITLPTDASARGAARRRSTR